MEKKELKKIDIPSKLSDIYCEQSRLAALCKKIVHNIDETLGTKLEEKKVAKPLKQIEKAISDRLYCIDFKYPLRIIFLTLIILCYDGSKVYTSSCAYGLFTL